MQRNLEKGRSARQDILVTKGIQQAQRRNAIEQKFSALSPVLYQEGEVRRGGGRVRTFEGKKDKGRTRGGKESRLRLQ